MQVSDKIRPFSLAALALGMVLAVMLAGCGQKGPLYRDAGNAAEQTTDSADDSQPSQESR